MRRKIFLFFAVCFLSQNYVISDEINFPPELFWWINEIKKVNPKIEIKDFKLGNREIFRLPGKNVRQGELTYPIFMRWNYSGNNVAYFNYNGTAPRMQKSRKYSIGGDFDDVGTLYIADKNKKAFYGDYFGVSEGLCAICWLTDTILIGVGININHDESVVFNVDLFIKEYRINNSNKTMEVKYYYYEKALKNDDRWKIKLEWYEQRPDYFEIR